MQSQQKKEERGMQKIAKLSDMQNQAEFINKEAFLFIKSHKQQLKQVIQKLKSENNWNISMKKYSSLQVSQILHSIEQENSLSCLWLHWNQDNQTILKISACFTKSLKILNIGGNLIQSIQLLQKNSFQNLQQAFFWNNKIVHVNCLRKMRWPKLKILDLTDNLISQASHLYEMNCPQLESLIINHNRIASINFIYRLRPAYSKLQVKIYRNRLVKVFSAVCCKRKQVATQVTISEQNKFKVRFG